jgi:hypothetical protein
MVYLEKSRPDEYTMHFCEKCHTMVQGEYYSYLDNEVLPDDQPLPFLAWFDLQGPRK